MIAIQHLNPGSRIRLADGGIAEIRENPRDGTWVIARRLSATGEAGPDDDLIHVDEVTEILPP